ncbi:hypothetical protein H5410_017531 [Solanum commersonii]|uniref:Protein kinase domain-containing protein n=1 Tax=Solanum commersonii TaxID=4109 RepID=A0A9J6A082_SOLCO|nr:hypothetical protein H5410_017531 [Solanum commersonii]
MSNNNLTGSTPGSIGRLTNLGGLNLGNSLLTGVIPSSIGNLTELVYLYLGLNRLEGNIPSTLGNYSQLLKLGISENNLTGTIPQQLFALSSLTNIYASYNSLTGSLPGNSLQGTIPNLEDLPDLQSLDLSQNNLSGPIPHFIASFTSLLYLNLSFNNLDGEVHVTGIFSNLSADVLNWNSELFGGIQELHLRPCVYQKTRKKHVLPSSMILHRMNIIIYLTAHLGDFGLVRLILDEDLTAQFSSLGVMGTMVVFLEYGMVNKVSALGDMYSFGILIWEIFTGRRPTDTLFQASSSPHYFVETALPEKVMEILDKTTFHGEMSKATNVKEYWGSIKKEEMECLVSILEIGVACSAESPRDRLTVTQVYSKLTLMREQFLQRGG